MNVNFFCFVKENFAVKGFLGMFLLVVLFAGDLFGVFGMYNALLCELG